MSATGHFMTWSRAHGLQSAVLPLQDRAQFDETHRRLKKAIETANEPGAVTYLSAAYVTPPESPSPGASLQPGA